MTSWHEMSVTERDELTRRYIQQGEQSWSDGGMLEDCPFGMYAQEAEWWRRGFMNAQLGASMAHEDRSQATG